MKKDIFNFNNQNSDNDNNDLLLEIASDLNEIINYINDNILKMKKNKCNEINLQEEENRNEKYEWIIDNNDKKEIKIKLGKKRKKSELLNENEDLKNKEFNEEYEIGNNKEEINKNKKKKKVKIRNKRNLKKSFFKIIGRIKNIIAKINDIKKNNNTLNNQEIFLKNGRYVGQVINGLLEGKGTTFLDNGDRYEGDYVNNKMEGKGIYYNNNGNIYNGEWRNDQPEGKGIEYYKNGDIYIGDFKNGLRDGKANIYYNNGDRYEGDYRNNLKDGKRVFYFNNGDRIMGDYSNGEPIGKHVKLYLYGEIEIITY